MLRSLLTRAALVGFLAALPGCRGVDFTERRDLDDPVMRLDDDPTEARFREKATATREAAPGAEGGAAGGCGCY
jgi:hypothetical protein